MWLRKKQSTAWFRLCLFQCVTGSMSRIHYRSSYHLRKEKTKTERRPRRPRWQSLSTHTCNCCGLFPVIQLLSTFCLCNICPVAPQNKKNTHVLHVHRCWERQKERFALVTQSALLHQFPTYLQCNQSSFASCSCMQTHTDIILTERSGFDFTKAAEFSGCHAAVTGSPTAKDIILAEPLRGKNTGDETVCLWLKSVTVSQIKRDLKAVSLCGLFLFCTWQLAAVTFFFFAFCSWDKEIHLRRAFDGILGTPAPLSLLRQHDVLLSDACQRVKP